MLEDSVFEVCSFDGSVGEVKGRKTNLGCSENGGGIGSCSDAFRRFASLCSFDELFELFNQLWILIIFNGISDEPN